MCWIGHMHIVAYCVPGMRHTLQTPPESAFLVNSVALLVARHNQLSIGVILHSANHECWCENALARGLATLRQWATVEMHPAHSFCCLGYEAARKCLLYEFWTSVIYLNEKQAAVLHRKPRPSRHHRTPLLLLPPPKNDESLSCFAALGPPPDSLWWSGSRRCCLLGPGPLCFRPAAVGGRLAANPPLFVTLDRCLTCPPLPLAPWRTRLPWRPAADQGAAPRTWGLLVATPRKEGASTPPLP